VATLREYRCAAHGEFEAFDLECPYGCSERFVTQEIRTAPGLHSDRTKRADGEMQNLARDYGLSDIANGSDGESVMQTLRKRPQFEPSWGRVEHAAPGFSQRGDVKTFDPRSMGAQPASVVQDMKSSLRPPTPRFVNRDKPA
jgi:hypothetical protein